MRRLRGLALNWSMYGTLPLDGHTRAAHGALDGQKRGKDGFFDTPVGKVAAPLQSGVASFDIHCRCRLRAEIPGYPPQMRYVRGDGKRSWMSYEEWREKVSEGKPPSGEVVYRGKRGGWVRKHSGRKEQEDAQNLRTARILADNGHQVELVKKSDVKSVKSADAFIDGDIWEIKTSFKPSKNAVRKAIKRASKQADRVVLHINGGGIEDKVLKEAISEEFSLHSNLSSLVLIKKDHLIGKFKRRAILEWKDNYRK